MKVILYPKVQRKALTFKGVKRVVVPDQSMSLKDIIKRFIRKESLPLKKEGYYEDRFGDLEKIACEDIVVQLERAAELKSWAEQVEARVKKLADDEAAVKAAADKAEAERRAKLDALLDQKMTNPVK